MGSRSNRSRRRISLTAWPRIAWRMAGMAGISVALWATLSEARLPFAAALVASADELPNAVPGEFLVQLREPSVSSSAQTQVLQELDARLGQALGLRIVARHALRTARDIAWLRLGSAVGSEIAPLPPAAILNLLRADPRVAVAEPNWIYRADVARRAPVASAEPASVPGASDRAYTPNDPGFARQWNLANTGQSDDDGISGRAGSDIGMLRLWRASIQGINRLKVAVIDTGIDWTHPDLRQNIYTNSKESGAAAHNGKDDDGNGFIDDVHGWNFVNDTPNSDDDEGHGSHCAGTIAARGNNRSGIAGVFWQAALVPIKFLDSRGEGTSEHAIEAVHYARRIGARVISNSWGGGEYSALLEQAIQRTSSSGALFVASAGNTGSNNDQAPKYPASYNISNIIAVAATNNRDARAPFSNYGSRTVEVAAPGVDILSDSKNGGYEVMSGTSMAAPHVSGLAALLWSRKSSLTAAQIKQRIVRTSVRVPGLPVLARGRVSAWYAVRNVVPTADAE